MQIDRFHKRVFHDMTGKEVSWAPTSDDEEYHYTSDKHVHYAFDYVPKHPECPTKRIIFLEKVEFIQAILAMLMILATLIFISYIAVKPLGDVASTVVVLLSVAVVAMCISVILAFRAYKVLVYKRNQFLTRVVDDDDNV